MSKIIQKALEDAGLTDKPMEVKQSKQGKKKKQSNANSKDQLVPQANASRSRNSHSDSNSASKHKSAVVEVDHIRTHHNREVHV